MEIESVTYRNKIRCLISRRVNLELEFILQRFWEKYSSQVQDEDLPELEKILEIDDLDLLDILLKRRGIPSGYRQDLFEMLLMK